MDTLLHLDASANARDSLSRRLTAAFAEEWKARSGGRAIYRDLDANPAPGVSSNLLEAIYAPPGTLLTPRQREALALSDSLVDEFLAADAYVFGVPMYNFSVPGSFKAWIDHVVRMGRTWRRGPKGMEGLLRGRRMLIVSTRAGDYGKGGPREGFDFHEPFLRKVFGLVGIHDIEYLPVINSPGRGDQAARSREAEDRARALAAKWAAEPRLRPEPEGASGALATA